jgi:hypothetical protein
MTSASGVLRKQKKRCQRAAPAARIRMALGCVGLGNQMEMYETIMEEEGRFT